MANFLRDLIVFETRLLRFSLLYEAHIAEKKNGADEAKKRCKRFFVLRRDKKKRAIAARLDSTHE